MIDKAAEFPESAREQRVRLLADILTSAAIYREALESVAALACRVTGEDIDSNSFSEEAVFDGSLTAEELLSSVEAGRYVKA